MKALDTIVRRARKRLVWSLALEQSALAAAAGLAGLILLLIAGTEILDWRWLALLVAGTLLLGLVRILRRAPSHYRVSQRLDRRVGSHDALSTAWYFAQPGSRPGGDEDVKASQRARAERLAQSVDVGRALPFAMPRALYAAAALAVTAGGLLGLRYGILRTLDLRPPIARVVFDFFHPEFRSAKNLSPEEKRLRELLKKGAEAVTGTDAKTRAELPPDQMSVESTDGAMAEDAKANRDSISDRDNQPESSDESVDGSTTGADNSNENGGEDGQPGKPPENGAARGKQDQEESSLLQKMREAMANLLDKLKIQPPKGGEGQPGSQASQNGLPSGQMKKGADPNGRPMPGKPQPGDARDPKGQGEQGEQTEAAQGGKSSKGERGSDERAAQDGRSGIGREDGDKSLREAENEAAMGKISEIIGKRSQKISGEMMVEVSSGKQQQLKTQYSDQRAAHAEAGGEIHRDEVPLIYQQYVQQYFEEIRKAPPAKSNGAGGAKQ